MVGTRDGRGIFGVKRIVGQMVRDDMDWRTMLLVVIRFEDTNGSSEAYDACSNDHDGSRRAKRRRHICCLAVGTPFAVLMDGESEACLYRYLRRIRRVRIPLSGLAMQWSIGNANLSWSQMLGDNTCSLLIGVIGENGTELPTVGEDSRYMLPKIPPS